MKYIAINDYPYASSKKFFEDFELAKEYRPDHNERLLNSRVYILKNYKETSYGINYEVDIDSVHYNTINKE